MEHEQNVQLKRCGLNGCDNLFSHFFNELLVSEFVFVP